MTRQSDVNGLAGVEQSSRYVEVILTGGAVQRVVIEFSMSLG